VIAIVGGLATAVLWATTLLGSSRSARLIGSWSTLGWVMLIGLAVSVPLVILTSPPVRLTQEQVVYLTAAGIANSGGLLFVYTALQRGKVGVVGPIVSTEGAIGATLAIAAGDPISGPAMACCAPSTGSASSATCAATTRAAFRLSAPTPCASRSPRSPPSPSRSTST
jgi:uncharacterized membrane protein